MKAFYIDLNEKNLLVFKLKVNKTSQMMNLSYKREFCESFHAHPLSHFGFLLCSSLPASNTIYLSERKVKLTDLLLRHRKGLKEAGTKFESLSWIHQLNLGKKISRKEHFRYKALTEAFGEQCTYLNESIICEVVLKLLFKGGSNPLHFGIIL